jgi:Amt family ammonium transporter
VQPWAAAVIGLIAGVLVVVSIFWFEKRGIDDPVSDLGHGVNGIWGVLSSACSPVATMAQAGTCPPRR